jgi:hypothetical protein
MKNLFCIILTSLLVSGCFAVDTTTIYNKSLTKADSESEPIYLGFHDNKHASFYFILKHKALAKEYFLHVRWISHNKDSLFDHVNTSMKFLVNNLEIITLHPIKTPRIIAYDLESNGHEEEAVFSLTYEQLSAIANAKAVEVELTGKYLIVVGHFNRIHTFKAFRNFLNES